ncbi:Hpt domain-containing protein, partial [Lysobacter sp. 2RAB21]
AGMSTGNLQDYSLHDLFRMEVEGQAQVLTEGLLVLETRPGSAAELESCMRAAHSIKGAARILGLSAAVAVAHVMEDCLVAAQERRIVLGHQAIDALLSGVDLLSRIAATPPEESEPWMRDDAPQAQSYCATLAAALTPEAESAPPSAPASETAAAADPAPAGDQPGDERVLRITARSLNRLLGLAGESLVVSRWLDPYIRSLSRLKRLQRDNALALDKLADTPGLSRDQRATALLMEARSLAAESQRMLTDRIAQLDLFERRTASVAHRLYDEALSSHMRPFADGTHAFTRM